MYDVRVQLDVGEVTQHRVEHAGLVEAGDGLLVAERVDHLGRRRAESGDVGLQLGGDVLVVGQHRLHRTLPVWPTPSFRSVPTKMAPPVSGDGGSYEPIVARCRRNGWTRRLPEINCLTRG
ncbi:MAG: hypothetical protein ACLQDY_29045 [Streptosporangiaceae bacterium]